MKNLLFLLTMVALLGTLVGCGPRLAKGPVSSDLFCPDSLKAKISLEVMDSVEGDHRLSAVLFAVPYKRYRMEISGPLGVGIASILWTDSAWTLVLPGQDRFARGRGYIVGGYAGIPLFDIHQLVSAFWGNTLPREASIDSTQADPSGASVLFGRNSMNVPFRALRNPDGRVAWISNNRERLEFDSYAEFGRLVVPSKIRVFRKGKSVLSISVKNVKSDAEWGNGIWRLPVPEHYELLP